MKITDVKTTVLSLPHVSGFKDATIRHMVKGRTQCFVHILTDEGLEGLGLTGGAQASREFITRTLKPVLIGQNPPHAYQLIHLHLACATPNLKIVEYLGIIEEADKIFYKEFPEPIDGMWSPYPDRPGLGLELDPAAVKKYSTV